MKQELEKFAGRCVFGLLSMVVVTATTVALVVGAGILLGYS